MLNNYQNENAILTLAVYQEINFGFTRTSSGCSPVKILPQKAEILFQLFLGLGLGLSLKRDRQRIETLTDKRCTKLTVTDFYGTSRCYAIGEHKIYIKSVPPGG